MAPQSKKALFVMQVNTIELVTWVRISFLLTLLEEALKQIYDFGDHVELTSIKVMTTMVPAIDSLQQEGGTRSRGMRR
jgi:hypothetical protein